MEGSDSDSEAEECENKREKNVSISRQHDTLLRQKKHAAMLAAVDSAEFGTKTEDKGIGVEYNAENNADNAVRPPLTQRAVHPPTGPLPSSYEPYDYSAYNKLPDGSDSSRATAHTRTKAKVGAGRAGSRLSRSASPMRVRALRVRTRSPEQKRQDTLEGVQVLQYQAVPDATGAWDWARSHPVRKTTDHPSLTNMKFPRYASSVGTKAALGERLVSDEFSRNKAVAIATANATAKSKAKSKAKEKKTGENDENEEKQPTSGQKDVVNGEESMRLNLMKWIEEKERVSQETDAMEGKKKKKKSKKKSRKESSESSTLDTDGTSMGEQVRLAAIQKLIAKELKKSARTVRNVDADEHLKMKDRQQHQEQKSQLSKKLQLLATNM